MHMDTCTVYTRQRLIINIYVYLVYRILNDVAFRFKIAVDCDRKFLPCTHFVIEAKCVSDQAGKSKIRQRLSGV